MKRAFILLALTSLALSCSTTPKRFADKPIVWEDNDKKPIQRPDPYWSALYWDPVDKTIFRKISHFFLFERYGRAKNVNAYEEVPNSSWYSNRMSRRQLNVAEVIKGPCLGEPINTKGPWLVIAGKTDGFNPGFVIKDETDGRRYVLKFDFKSANSERATSADAIGTRIYHAAGFSTPCNSLIEFDPKIIKLSKHAKKKDHLGRKSKMTQKDVEGVLERTTWLPDGRKRGMASLFLEGKPIGQFRYEDTRSDDPNDAIKHEDRRELRGSRLLAAWLNHFDAREQNTLNTFMKLPNSRYGYVRHNILDFGDCFGSQWDKDEMSRRFGHSYYLDWEHASIDFITLGLLTRPWDTAKIAQEAPMFGYYDVDNFVPQDWQNGYATEAFDRMDAQDGFWMAKIISRFTDEHVDALVDIGKLSKASDATYLKRTMKGRRDKIVRYYMNQLAAFDIPEIKGNEVCLVDLLVSQGYEKADDTKYELRLGERALPRLTANQGQFCVSIPENSSGYLILEAGISRGQQAAKPLQIHLKREPSLKLLGLLR